MYTEHDIAKVFTGWPHPKQGTRIIPGTVANTNKNAQLDILRRVGKTYSFCTKDRITPSQISTLLADGTHGDVPNDSSQVKRID